MAQARPLDELLWENAQNGQLTDVRLEYVDMSTQDVHRVVIQSRLPALAGGLAARWRDNDTTFELKGFSAESMRKVGTNYRSYDIQKQKQNKTKQNK